ncbi:MAG TPA: protein kinase [Enhygromyxa sp.]|nr:protein kinase [Enhygromyxa sp.]
MPSLAGQKLDKYDMLEEVGHGGMAVVYRGRDTILDREVAVKVLHAHLADREESRRRLEREAKTVAKLHHDNIVEIFDSSDPSRARESYIVCEFIHGVTLRDWLDDRWVPRPVLAAMIAHRLCLPLEHAHSMGIVHRDIKPENVMIREDGVLKLMDFGIAQILDTQRLTTTGQLLGSPAYMAPELINGKPVDKRIDIFALGVMLYQLATGELPFSGRNPAQVLNRILEGDYKPAAQINSKVDEDLEAIIAKALALKPDDRYQSANSLANALQDYLQQFGLEPTPEELASYFANPESYVDELDHRVCRELMRRATRAMRDGNGARALKLLSRVLELDPHNKRAAAMLDRVRIRGQRMRTAALIGGALALVGIVSAGVLLLQPEPPKPDRIVSQDRERTASNGDYIIPTQVPPDAPPLETGDSGETGGTGETAEELETGSDDDGGRVRPIGTSGGGSNDGGEPAKQLVTCIVIVEGLPAVALADGEYEVVVSGGARVPLPQSGQVEVQIEHKTSVWLSPKDKYRASDTLDPVDCKAGVIRLRADPAPAKLNFQAGAIPLASISVSCISGCAHQDRVASKFPVVPLDRGETERWIELEFKSKGYKPKPKKYLIVSGNNSLSINLDKI